MHVECPCNPAFEFLPPCTSQHVVLQVVSVAGEDWMRLAAGRDKAEYLALKLCRAGVPVAAFGAAGPPGSRAKGISGRTIQTEATAYELIGSAT